MRSCNSSAILLFLSLLPSVSFANDTEGENFIIEDLLDSYEWHITSIGSKNITIPLPVILISSNYDFDLFLSNKFRDNHGHVSAYRGYIIDNGKIISVDGRSFIDLSITKNVLYMFISMLILLMIAFHSVTWYKKKSYDVAPNGLISVVEMLVLYVKDEVAIPNIGVKYYRRFMPYLLTVFFFIFLNNLLGLLPGAVLSIIGNIRLCLTSL